jgi:hypothetical protein
MSALHDHALKSGLSRQTNKADISVLIAIRFYVKSGREPEASNQDI